MDDGRKKFYEYLDVDKVTKKLLYFFMILKSKMLKDKDDYVNGKVYTDKER